MNRFFVGRFAARIGSSWHMYPLGVLFGLGFDTASEVGLLAISAGVATHHVPFLAVISLPLLFAAGMSLMDTADGAFMSQAYGWAFSNPVRRVYYNITVTSLSVAVALLIGSIELLQVASAKLGLDNGFSRFLAGLDFGLVGYGIVGAVRPHLGGVGRGVEDAPHRAALERARRLTPGGRGAGRVESPRMPRKRGRRPARSVVFRRWLAVGALVLVALLYYRPLRAYVDARGQLNQHRAVVRRLEAQKATLERRLGSSTSLATLAREARALGYVKPGERLYIVKGIEQWRKRERATMMGPRGR